MIFNTGSGGNATRIVTGKSLHLADTAGGKYKNIKLVGASAQNGTPAVSKPVDIVSNKVKSITGCGKNLLKFSQGSTESNGITFTVNADKSVTVNGKATADAVLLLTTSTRGEIDLNSLTGKNIILSGCPNGGSNTTYKLQFWSASKSAVDTGNGATLNLSTVPESWNFAISIISGTTVNNLTFKPMLRLDSIIDDTYEPYTAITAELDEEYTLNGLNGIYDEIDLERGVRIQRVYKKVFTGNESFRTYSPSFGGVQFGCEDENIMQIESDNVLCTHLPPKFTWDVREDGIAITISNSFLVRFRIESLGIYTVADLKAKLKEWYDTGNPMVLYAPIKTPIETPLSVDELIAFNKLRAYKSGSSLLNSGGCDMEVEYFLNNKVGQPMADIHMNTAKYILDGATLNIIV